MTAYKQFVRGAMDRVGLTPLYFRFIEWRMARGREKPPATDENGAPIPPLELMARVSAHADWREFLASGERTATALAGYAADAGAPFATAQRILDLGCGCGRVIRWLPAMTQAELYGVDYNPSLANWCAANLKGDFRVNRLNPPLDFPDAQFDIVYLLSVFTHLRLATQREWLAEIDRVLRPGGLALITFHDEEQPGLPDSEEARRALAADEFYIYNDLAEGSNLIATFQTRAFTARLFGERFEVARIVPSRQTAFTQAIAVLRKKSAT